MRMVGMILPMLAVSFAVAAADTPARGLDRVHVRIVHVSEAALDAGVSEEDLVRELSLRVGTSDILVLSGLPGNWPEGPFLGLILEVLELPADEMAYHISLELNEEVLLERSRTRFVSASTWYTSAFGIVPASDLPEEALTAALALADEFLVDAGHPPH